MANRVLLVDGETRPLETLVPSLPERHAVEVVSSGASGLDLLQRCAAGDDGAWSQPATIIVP